MCWCNFCCFGAGFPTPDALKFPPGLTYCHRTASDFIFCRTRWCKTCWQCDKPSHCCCQRKSLHFIFLDKSLVSHCVALHFSIIRWLPLFYLSSCETFRYYITKHVFHRSPWSLPALPSCFTLPFFFLSFFLHHCKLFPSLLLKWHLQMRVKSGRQWISNWKRHWTEDNATGSMVSNQMIWNVKWCEIVAELNFMLPPSSMQHFFSSSFFLVTLSLGSPVKTTLFSWRLSILEINKSKRSN